MIVLTVPVVQLKLKNTTFCECQRHTEIRAMMLNEVASYCVPDLNTVLVGLTASDFQSNYIIIITEQKYILDRKRFEHLGWTLSLPQKADSFWTVL